MSATIVIKQPLALSYRIAMSLPVTSVRATTHPDFGNAQHELISKMEKL